MGKRRSRKGVIVIFLLCFVILIYSIHKLLKRAEPVFVAQSSNYSNTAFTDLVSKCVIRAADQEYFKDFYEIIPNSTDGITALKADTAKINKAISNLMIDIQNSLNADYPAEIYIPLGSLSGYYLLSSSGPLIPVKIIPISIVNGTYEEEFESTGINQVRHKIYLKITVDMLYQGYLLHETERIEMTVPISETIISGEVPEYYGDEWEVQE